jgi:hypothetical protein
MQSLEVIDGTVVELSWLIQITSALYPTKKSNMGPGEVHIIFLAEEQLSFLFLASPQYCKVAILVSL